MRFRHLTLPPERTSACSCGTPVDKCPINWGPAFATALAGSTINSTVAADIERLVHHRKGPPPYLADLCRILLERVAQGSKARLLVDSSQKLSFGRLLNAVTGGAISYIHLTRDPRAAVHSCIRKGVTRQLSRESRARILVELFMTLTVGTETPTCYVAWTRVVLPRFACFVSRRGASRRGGDARRFMVSKAVAVAAPGADRPLLVELAAVPHLSDRAIRAGCQERRSAPRPRA